MQCTDAGKLQVVLFHGTLVQLCLCFEYVLDTSDWEEGCPILR